MDEDTKHSNCESEYKRFEEEHTFIEKGIVNDFCSMYTEFFKQQRGMISQVNHFIDKLETQSASAVRASLRRSPAIVLGIGMPAAAGAGYAFTRLMKNIRSNLKKIKFWLRYSPVSKSDIFSDYQNTLAKNGLAENEFFYKHEQLIKEKLLGMTEYINDYNKFVERLKNLK